MWIDSILPSENPMVRFAVAALFFFGPLYLIAGSGHAWASLLAWLGFASVVLYRYGSGRSTGGRGTRVAR